MKIFLQILFKLSRLNFSVIILHVGAVMSAEPSCGIPTIISGASESADQGNQKRSAADLYAEGVLGTGMSREVCPEKSR